MKKVFFDSREFWKTSPQTVPLAKAWNDVSANGMPGARIFNPSTIPTNYGTAFDAPGILFNLHKDDAPISLSKRAEIFTERAATFAGQFNTIEFTTIFPGTFANDTLPELFFQLVGNDYNRFNPNLALWVRNGQFSVNQKYTRADGTNFERNHAISLPFMRRTPIRWMITFRKGIDGSGLVIVSANGVQRLRISGQNCNIIDGKPEASHFIKFGLYKWPWMKTFTPGIEQRQLFISDIIISQII